MRIGIGRTQLGHPPELARRFVQHAGLVERDAQIAVLLDPGVGHLQVFGGGGTARAMQEARGHEAVERFPHFELAQPRGFDHLIPVARSVEQRQEPILGLGQLRVADLEPIAVDEENQIERGDLLLDEAPLVHAPRDRKSTRLNSSHGYISYAVFCLKKKTTEACRKLTPGSPSYCCPIRTALRT